MKLMLWNELWAEIYGSSKISLRMKLWGTREEKGELGRDRSVRGGGCGCGGDENDSGGNFKEHSTFNITI